MNTAMPCDWVDYLYYDVHRECFYIVLVTYLL